MAVCLFVTGNVFWKFCEEQVKGAESTEDEEEAKHLPMPPMIPIVQKKVPAAPPAKKNIPPPPPLSHMRANQPKVGASRFLPKSLAPRPKLPSSITITPTVQQQHKGGNGITTSGGVSILKEKITESNVTSQALSESVIKIDTKTHQQLRKSPALITRQVRLSSGSASSIPAQKVNPTPPPPQQYQEEYGDIYPG